MVSAQGIDLYFSNYLRNDSEMISTDSLKVAVMKSSGKFVVCDRGNERSRMQIFTKHGHFVRFHVFSFFDLLSTEVCQISFYSNLCHSFTDDIKNILPARLHQHSLTIRYFNVQYFRKIAIRYIDIVAGLAITRWTNRILTTQNSFLQ